MSGLGDSLLFVTTSSADTETQAEPPPSSEPPPGAPPPSPGAPPPDVLDVLDGFDLDALPDSAEGADTLMSWIAWSTAIMDVIAQRRMTWLRRYDRDFVCWHDVPDTESYLPLRLGMTKSTARRTMKTARKLEDYPEIDAAFAEGRLSQDKVEQLVRLDVPAAEGALKCLAQSWDGEKTRRVVEATLRVRAAERKRPVDPAEDPRKLSWRYLDGGMERLIADLFPEEAAMVRTLIAEGKLRAEREAPRPEDDPPPPETDGWSSKQVDESDEGHAGRTRPRARDVDGLLHAAEEYLAWAAEGKEATHPGRFEVQVIVQAEPVVEGAAAAAGSDCSHGDDVDGSQGGHGDGGQGRDAGGGADGSHGRDADGGHHRDACGGHGGVDADARSGGRSAPFNSPPVGDVGWRLRGAILDRFRTPLHSDVLDRVLCDSPVVELVETPDGKLDLGRRTRRISQSLRRALNLRDPFCQWPGCYRESCHAHHLQPWIAGGPTKLSNLVNLCHYHHRLVHEAGWSLKFRDGRWVALGPQGQCLEGVARPPPVPEDVVDMFRQHAASRGVFVDGDSSMPVHVCDEQDFNLREIGQMLYEAVAIAEGREWPFYPTEEELED